MPASDFMDVVDVVARLSGSMMVCDEFDEHGARGSVFRFYDENSIENPVAKAVRGVVGLVQLVIGADLKQLRLTFIFAYRVWVGEFFSKKCVANSAKSD